MISEFLRKVSLFANLAEEDFERLCGMVEEVHLESGERLFDEGDPGDRAYIVRDGDMEILKQSEQREVLLAVSTSGAVIGEMALLEKAPRMASVRARTDSTLLAIHQEQFDHLLETSPSAARAMLNTVLNHWRDTQAVLQQSEKMTQLGTLAAGVAHELNNPAAAVKRGAEQLQTAIGRYEETHARLNQLNLDESQLEQLKALADETQKQAAQPSTLDTVIRIDQESGLEGWLDDHGIENAWELAPTLVYMGVSKSQLDDIASSFSSEQLAALLSWLTTAYLVYALLAEIGHGAGRLSEIVKALKSYSYLDQAPVQAVNIHEGIDNTLIILRNKLKYGIEVIREYAEDLPRIQAYGSELNQVWTNILDNAADALNGPGKIIIRTYQESDWVVVELEDNGPGIPEEIQTRIFDPFFTTKPPGKGTGLGLHVSYNIIVQKHRGNIKLTSEPGKTCFQIYLPLNFDER